MEQKRREYTFCCRFNEKLCVMASCLAASPTFHVPFTQGVSHQHHD